MFEGFPVEVSVAYEGERVRAPDMQVEFGGPNVERKFELVRLKPESEIEDEKIEIIGPDISELKEGGSFPLAIYIEVAGKELEKDMEPVVERRIHMYTNYIEGFWHIASRDTIWLRLSKKSFKKGLTSFRWIGLALLKLFKAELSIIEKMKVTFVTNPAKIEEMYGSAKEIYETRDARAREMKDEDVEEFYGCVLCQSFAPPHVCVITPNRVSLCGSINWFDARAAVKIDPEGPNFVVPKGECLDPVKGEYTGVNQIVDEKSLGQNSRYFLYSMFELPPTSCGCFEAIAFYIPDVDGIAIVHRGFKGETVNGLPFSTMAGQTGGGIQTEGFLGLGIEYMRSPKFFQADGGWSRIVWMPKELKERVKNAIPPDLLDKIATEEVTNISALMDFLKGKKHPVLERAKS